MSVRSGDAVRPEHVKFADRLLVVGSYAAVMWKRPELEVRSNRVEWGKRSRSTAPHLKSRRGNSFGSILLGLVDTSCQWDFREFATCRGKGIGDAVVCPVATSVLQSVGYGFRALGRGTQYEAHRALPW